MGRIRYVGGVPLKMGSNKALLPIADRVVPWKCIWITKAPPRVAFFVWATALGLHSHH
jgi:hypothetical protein